jgi:hypothetical protein
MGVEKWHVARGEKKYNFQKGVGGINIVFGPKYRPLCEAESNEDFNVDPDPGSSKQRPHGFTKQKIETISHCNSTDTVF